MKRRKTRAVRVGNLFIGGEYPISVQTMTNTDTRDIKKTIAQIKKIEEAGADLVRVSIPDEDSADALRSIVSSIGIPVVADIHFNYKLALAAVINGAAKIRINPGTIGSEKSVKEIIKLCKEYNVPIRIGLNAASLPRKFKGLNHTEALIEAAKYWVSFFEDEGFFDIVISAKSSSVIETIETYSKLAEVFDYPFHLGVTESGTKFSGSIRSAVAISILLHNGIGDTIRVSLSSDPVDEVRAGIEILKSLELRKGPIVISCPTCARTTIDVEKIASEVENMLLSVKIPLKVAVMGCEVNGPGEARDADLGLAGTKRGVMLFKKGKPLGVYSSSEAFEYLLKLIKEEYLKEDG
ncbi:MAG: flavodoxin-dependent (E)-4-hydroxy-3-methylbut-2-enyl-diphosphate synthase [Actinobacteria bacterium]|nr:flavodoxin-dependent (E)-4-hydroxy-3-methylbut-2-enyl-diphosphate synthase [Actinomycetota bacterium]